MDNTIDRFLECLREFEREEAERKAGGEKMRGELLKFKNEDLGIALRLFISRENETILTAVNQITDSAAKAFSIWFDLYNSGCI